MQTIGMGKWSVVIGAVFAMIAAVYFSDRPTHSTGLVLTAPLIIAPSETEGAMAIWYLKPSPFTIPDRKSGRRRRDRAE